MADYVGVGNLRQQHQPSVSAQTTSEKKYVSTIISLKNCRSVCFSAVTDLKLSIFFQLKPTI